jgi:hypothetical protein
MCIAGSSKTKLEMEVGVVSLGASFRALFHKPFTAPIILASPIVDVKMLENSPQIIYEDFR